MNTKYRNQNKTYIHPNDCLGKNNCNLQQKITGISDKEFSWSLSLCLLTNETKQ